MENLRIDFQQGKLSPHYLPVVCSRCFMTIQSCKKWCNIPMTHPWDDRYIYLHVAQNQPNVINLMGISVKLPFNLPPNILKMEESAPLYTLYGIEYSGMDADAGEFWLFRLCGAASGVTNEKMKNLIFLGGFCWGWNTTQLYRDFFSKHLVKQYNSRH